MLKESPNHRVYCEELAKVGAYHKGASRISELRKIGYEITFTPGGSWADGYYQLIREPDLPGIPVIWEGEQRVFA